MTKEFVNFYVFDGELAQDLLDHEKTHAERAVESLFQIHLLERMRGKVREYWDEQTKNSTAKTDRGVTRREAQLRLWEARLKELLQARSKAAAALSANEDKLQDLLLSHRQQIAKHEALCKEIEEARGEVGKLTQEVADLSKRVVDKMRAPHSVTPDFSHTLSDLKDGLDRVKLPEGAAREFFQELASEPECVCGRPIDEFIKEIIKDRSHHYLGTDDVSFLNAMKTSIVDALGSSQSIEHENLSDEIRKLSTLCSDHLPAAHNRLDALTMTAEKADPKVRILRQDIEQLKAEIRQLRGELRRYDEEDSGFSLDTINKQDPRRIVAIKTVKKGIDRLTDLVNDASKSYELTQCRDRLHWILTRAQQNARAAILNDIRDCANSRITELMPHNEIRIASIDGCLKLSGQSAGSVGETLSVGYAFLATLFNRANEHSLPFIVDSPANPIDLAIRSSIGELVPKLTEQFIAFVISSEREKFLPSLREASCGEIRYITLFRSGVSHYDTKASAFESCAKSVDGLSVIDEGFFNEFQLDLEEN